MSCAAFDTVAGELVRDRLPIGPERDAAFAHAEKCPRCALRLVDERALAADLRALTLGTERAEAPERVEQALRAAWRERRMEPVAAEALRLPSKRPTWLWGAAAALLLSAGVAVLGRREPTTAATPTPFPAVAEAAPRNAPPVTAPARPAHEAMAATRRSSIRSITAAPPAPRATTPLASGDADDGAMTGFASLDGSSSFEDFESVHVVRVDLSPATLSALGWPVSDDGEARVVRADVVLAEDGVARAIRLVEPE